MISGVLFVWFALDGCSPDDKEATQPDTVPPQVTIVSPLANSAVADTVHVQVDASDDGALRRVTLLVNDTAAGVRYQPPLTIPWATGDLADSSFWTLRVEAVDEAGNSALSAPCPVCVRRNAPPSVRILQPGAGQWMDLENPLPTWRCIATDPDEGELPPERIVWFLDGDRLETQGIEINAPPLSASSHEILVRVRDHWDRLATDRHEIIAFRYPGCAQPSTALETFLCGVRARNPDVAITTLADGFTAHSPTDPSGQWNAVSEESALRALLQGDELETLSLDVWLGRPELLAFGGQEIAKVELHGLYLTARLCCGEQYVGGPEEVSLRVANSAARIFLARDGSKDTAADWRLQAWWDLHGATWCGRTGLSWTELKQVAIEERLCRHAAR